MDTFDTLQLEERLEIEDINKEIEEEIDPVYPEDRPQKDEETLEEDAD